MASQPGAPQPQSWSPFRPTHAVFYSLAGALALAIANGLTKDTLLPAITRSIVEFIDPSTVSVKLKEPAENITAVKVKENWKLVENQVEIRHINNDTLNLKLAPGAYIARFEKGADNNRQVATINLAFKESGDERNVENLEWHSDTELKTNVQGKAAEGLPDLLSGTRWLTAPDDFAQIASAPDTASKAILANALLQVGIDGRSANDEARIGSYLAAAPMKVGSAREWWGGTFLAWVVKKSDVDAPAEAYAFKSWQGWGVAANQTDPKPGSIAIFGDIPLKIAPSALLVGGTHPRRAALLRSEANWMFCLYGRQYRQCENRGFNDREAAAS
ncbi:hypothetical protein LZK82_09810 [Rhizobium leguminosarum]|nr:hypothetical protein LZK82_09810 [Rhizobium leguminosarum]